MERWIIFSLMVIGLTSAVEFTCDNVPVGITVQENDLMTLSYTGSSFQAGQHVTVTVGASVDYVFINHFAIQARDDHGQVWGTWETSTETSLQTCESGDMLTNSEHLADLASIDVTWITPTEVMPSKVKFVVTALINENNEVYFTYSSPEITLEGYDPHSDPSEFAEGEHNPNMDEQPATPQNSNENGDGIVGNPGEDPNGGEGLYGDASHLADELDDNGGVRTEATTAVPTVDLHDPEPEIAQARANAAHHAELIRLEDANSEGDWSVQEEEERRQRQEEYDWELREQERIQYEEEKKRQEIVLWEIRDKEEHDSMIAAQSTPAPPGVVQEERDEGLGDELELLDGETAGSASVMATLLTVITAFILTLA